MNAIAIQREINALESEIFADQCEMRRLQAMLECAQTPTESDDLCCEINKVEDKIYAAMREIQELEHLF